MREGIPKGDRVSQRSAARTVLARAWLPLVAVVAVAVGALCMWKVHQSSAPGRSSPSTAPRHPRSSLPSGSRMSCTATSETAACSSYIDIDGHPHRVDLTSLPWSHTETTTLTVVSGSISAQVHGGQVGCRMLVNDVVRDEQSATRQDADVTCRVKSA